MDHSHTGLCRQKLHVILVSGSSVCVSVCGNLIQHLFMEAICSRYIMNPQQEWAPGSGYSAETAFRSWRQFIAYCGTYLQKICNNLKPWGSGSGVQKQLLVIHPHCVVSIKPIRASTCVQYNNKGGTCFKALWFGFIYLNPVWTSGWNDQSTVINKSSMTVYDHE